MTYPHPTASGDYSSRTGRDNEYPTPAPTGAGQPGSAGDQSGGGHHRFRRRGPFSRLLHRGQPTGARAGVPTGAAAGAPAGAAAGAAAERRPEPGGGRDASGSGGRGASGSGGRGASGSGGRGAGGSGGRGGGGSGGRSASGSGGRSASGSGAGRGAADAQGVRTTGVQVLASRRSPGQDRSLRRFRSPQARRGRRMPPRPTWRLRSRTRPARRPGRPGTARSIARPAPSSPGSPRPRPGRPRASWASERSTSASIPSRRPGSTSLAAAWTRNGDRVCPATATQPGGTPARCPRSRDRHGHGRRCPRRLRTG